MIKIYSYFAEEPGPDLVILGAIHGNETCGVFALRRLIESLESGAVTLSRGKLHLVPVCNPLAFEKGVRFIERNLNRHLVPQAAPDCYEARLGNILVPLLQAADVVLDLHSSPRGVEPYVFVGPPREAEFAYAASLGLRTLMNGWEDAYAGTKGAAGPGSTEGIGTEQVLRQKGGLAALVECGTHDDPEAQNVAWRAICGALTHFDMARGLSAPPRAQAQRLVTIQKVFYHETEGRMAQPWQDFDPVSGGDPLAFMMDGSVIRAPADGVVILPDPVAPLGQEWFYFGVDTALSTDLGLQSAIA